MNRIIVFLFIFLFLISCESNQTDQIPNVNIPNQKEQTQINIKYYLSEIKNHPDDAELYFNLAQNYISLNNIEEAYQNVKKAVELEPENRNYLVLFMECLHLKKLNLDALEILEKLTFDESKDQKIMQMAINIYLQTNNYKKALRLIEKTSSKDDNPLTLTRKAFVYSIMGDTNNAIALLDNAIGIDSNYTPAKIQLAALVINFEDYGNAKLLLLESLKQDTSNAFLFYNLGLVYKGLSKKDSALICYEKSIQLDSSNAKALYLASIILLQKNKFEKAERYLQKVKLLKSDIPNIDFKLAVTKFKLSKYEEALAIFEKIDSSDVNNYNFAQESIKEIRKKYNVKPN
ncbi:MAG: tetratricopeptide repeat protein [Bacteroidota bacterium]|nr:tetratricopeptide repeat protein [Bacteroidota bacterium]